MQLCRDTITLYNGRYEPRLDREVWRLTLIEGVSWYQTSGAAQRKTQLSPQDTLFLRIPIDARTKGKIYVDPLEYKRLADPTDTYTLNEGDIVVHGIADVDILSPAEAHRLYPGAVTILSVRDNRRAPNAPHFLVLGGQKWG